MGKVSVNINGLFNFSAESWIVTTTV